MTQKNNHEKQSAFCANFVSKLTDPRRTSKGNLRHNFSDILFLVISSVISGLTDWEDMELFGKNQISWLKKYGEYKNGIPSHDTINRLISSLEPEKFSQCFIEWISDIATMSPGEVVAIDGKSIRGSAIKSRNISPVHVISAYASENELCLGQYKTDSKSNEITAIPKLLDLLAIKGCTVTIDAMGCQTDIAKKVCEKEADYILAVKGNQGTLELGIKDAMLLSKPVSTDIEEDFGHGRIEKRICSVYTDLSHIELKEKWIGLKCLVSIKSEVLDKTTGKEFSEERLYISSLQPDAKYINRAVRKHWGIENKLHWNLDVVFGEDASHKRTGYAAQNVNIISKIALSMIQKETSFEKGKKKKMLLAMLDNKYREKLLNL